MNNINKLELTDDELSVIQTALHMTLLSYDHYEKKGNILDFQNEKLREEMKVVFDKFNAEYF